MKHIAKCFGLLLLAAGASVTSLAGRVPADVRVAPLLQSRWSQGQANGVNCWNRFTPDNNYCGCAATAMAQIMRLHRHPQGNVPGITNECSVDGKTMPLTMEGGVYDWDAMTLAPIGNAAMTTRNYDAIGKLSSDVGISIYMKYDLLGRGGAGANVFDIAIALRSTWGYGSAVYFDPRTIEPQSLAYAEWQDFLQKALFANFDVGCPVCLGLPGHVVVADGYGFTGGVPYVHVNFGYADDKDGWYAMPDLSSAGRDFTSIDDAVYNIFPSNGISCAVISGRVLDSSGRPVPGASIEVLDESGSTVASCASTASGVWGAIVPASGGAATYRVAAQSSDGKLSGASTPVEVFSPAIREESFGGLERKVTLVEYADGLGNSWGNDIVLMPPSAEWKDNDEAVGAVAISGLGGTDQARNAEATADDAEPLLSDAEWGLGYAGSTIWWKWDAPADGVASFDTHGSDFDTVIGVCAIRPDGGTTMLASNDDDAYWIRTSGLSFNCVGGASYYVIVGSGGNATGNVRLNWSVEVRNAVPSLAALRELFPDDAELLGNVMDDAGLAAFNDYLAECGVVQASSLSSGQRRWAYRSYMVSQIATVPRLYDAEPVLRISSMKIVGGVCEIGVSLRAGGRDIPIVRQEVERAIRVGKSPELITETPEIEESEGDGPLFRIRLGDAATGFIKLILEDRSH